jgi:hypothetical protein
MTAEITASLERQKFEEMPGPRSEPRNPGSSGSLLSPGPPAITNADKIIKRYLREHASSFGDLDDLREKVNAVILQIMFTDLTFQGWLSPKGDEYFNNLRSNADNADKARNKRYYEMNISIGRQLANAGAFMVTSSNATSVQALNLCMAPGGYTYSLLRANPSARVSGITLPLEMGGHAMLLPYGDKDPRVHVEFMDVTMMAPEYGTSVQDIPSSHPEAASFAAQIPY